jgi:hypothetical protein
MPLTEEERTNHRITRVWRRVKVAAANQCWLWTGSTVVDHSWTTPRQYGRILINGKQIRVHRFVYSVTRHPVPDGMVVDHLCRNTLCVNPSHLEMVTPGENTRRGVKSPKRRCPYGHEYSPENTLVRSGKKVCRVCYSPKWRQEIERRSSAA